MKKDIIIKVKGLGEYKTKEGITIKGFLEQHQLDFEIIACSINGEVMELSRTLDYDLELELISTHQRIGRKIYRNGLKLLYFVAVKELYGKNANIKLKHSIDKGIYSEILIGKKITPEIVKAIKNKMKEIADRDLPIEKISVSRQDITDYYSNVGEEEKSRYLVQLSYDFLVLYQLLNYYNYFYYYMPSSTGVLKYFDLILLSDGKVVLMYPNNGNNEIPKYTHMEKVIKVFNDYEKWCEDLNVKYVPDLNDIIIKGNINEFIQLNEIRQNEDISNIANTVYKNRKNIKMILIAGPSSSGKTTTSKKLSLYLKEKGLKPFIVSTDDYYKERIESPKDKNGNFNFEILEALDFELFNKQMKELLSGKKVSMPTFNFVTGEKEFKTPEVGLKENEILVIEGLHALNEKLTKGIEKKNKFKLYISPFTPLGIDIHNHVSTVDIRFLRRLVRDYQFRGYSAEHTLSSWKNMREAEEKYVFPYQNDADAILNTALIYETGMLKIYATPLLLSIKPDSQNYEEAARIISFLNCFIAIPSDKLPETGLLREFIGNGYF